MIENKIETKRIGRYYTIGKFSDKTRHVIVAFHGFGQLGAYFGKKFEFLESEDTFILIPEGLSRFYLNDNYNRVGASWITKDMKDDETQDYLFFLNQIFEKTVLNNNKFNLSILGFSQGCATAARWLNQLNRKCTNLIFWAGFFANGISDILDIAKIKETNVFYVYGNQDPFIIQFPELASKSLKDIIINASAEIIAYPGNHSVDSTVLKQIFSKINPFPIL